MEQNQHAKNGSKFGDEDLRFDSDNKLSFQTSLTLNPDQDIFYEKIFSIFARISSGCARPQCQNLKTCSQAQCTSNKISPQLPRSET